MLNFTLNEPVEMSFKVGIAGSGAVPQRVTVVLKQDNSAGLTFEAHSTGDGAWAANINVPSGALAEGTAQLAIEVLLNNKLFVPVRETVEITAQAEPSAPTEPPVTEPAIEPTTPPVTVQPEDQATPATPVPPPAPVATEEKKAPVKVSLLKETEQKTHKRRVSKHEVTKIFEGAPPKVTVDAAKRKLAEANKRLERKPFGKLVEDSHPPVQVQVTSQPVFHIKKTKIVTR